MGHYYGVTFSSQKDSLAHYGILGQKWGVRRFQNEDGTLTDAGKKRYGSSLDEVKSNMEKAQKREIELRRRSDDLNSRTGFKAVFTTNDFKNARARKKAAKAEKEAAEIEGVYDRMKKAEETKAEAEKKIEADPNEPIILTKKDGTAVAFEYKKFNEKADKKIRSEIPSDKEIKALNQQMKDTFKALGFDLDKAFGNGGLSKSAFNSKSEAEQLYIMFHIGEGLGLIEIPDGFFY